VRIFTRKKFRKPRIERMKTGLVLGKFCPLHVGHIGLIEFAAAQCDELLVLVCAEEMESIAGDIRLQWVVETFREKANIKPMVLHYRDAELPSSSVSSQEISKLWAIKLQTMIAQIDVIFSSEAYGDYLAAYLHCEHISYEPTRITHPISATEIRANTIEKWSFLAEAAKGYYK
jgi:HTH-type transcriptional repressor of NAD biosynthesis genes